MNLSFSTKLCIVACHSDTYFKKQIIKHNHPLLKKIANTIYINSSKYDKTIPMIHTSKLDKYDKYKHVLSTVNLQQYNLILWMTDELLLTFSLLPLFAVAVQRGYHEYKDIIVQTPMYFLNPFPLTKIEITPTNVEPSFFKSSTVIIPIHTVSTETIEQPIETFTLDGSYTPSASILPIHTISVEQPEPFIDTFTLDGLYTTSASILPIHTISDEQPEPFMDTFTIDGLYTPSASIVPIHTISDEQPEEFMDTFTLDGLYTPSASIVPIHIISDEQPEEFIDTFTIDGLYTPSASIVPIHTNSDDQPEPIPKDVFKLTNNISYSSPPVVTVHPSKSHVKPISNRQMLSNTMISYSNVLFSNKSIPIKEKVKEKVKSKTWKQEFSEIQKIQLPERVESTYESIIISFAPLPYLEYCLRKMILHLPTWSHTIVCGNMNTDLITSWNLPIHVISLDIDNITSEQYDELLSMASFWELFQGETLLLYNKPLEYNMDSYLLNKVLEPGISIRNKDSFINYLSNHEEGITEELYFEQYAI